MTLKFIISLFFIAFVFSTSANAFATKSEAIAELLKTYNAKGDFEGVVLAARNGKIIHRQAVGLANREWKVPHRADTRFRICSITKQFTAMLVMQLVEAGKLQLDASVADYLPAFRKDIGSKITLRNLLSSASGLPTFDDNGFWQKSDEQLGSPSFTVKNYIGGNLIFEPGERFNYNNGDFILLGAILEQVTGKAYEQLLNEKILSPLGMKQTGVLKQAEVTENLANGYVKQNSRVFNEPYYHVQNYSSAGAMYSTADDLLLWDTALLTNKLLSRKYTDEMFTPLAKLGFAALGSWVYSLKMPTGKEIKVVERRGNTGGFCTLNLIVPESGYALVFLSNTETQTLFNTYASKGLSYEVLRILAS